jgi:outer membrane lipoprotein-sorting protein
MSNRDQLASDEVLDEAVHCFRSMVIQDNPPAQLSQSVLADLNDAGPKVSLPVGRQRRRGRDPATASRRWSGTVASLAAITLLCLGFWFTVSGNVSLADAVVDAVSRVKSVTYEIVETVDGKPDKSTRVMVSGPERIRAEFPNGEVLIVDTSKERQIRLISKAKRAIVRSAFASDAVSTVASHRLSPLESLRKMGDFATSELPSRVIEGKQMIGFLCNEGPYVNLKVWVDPDTKLPVRMESSCRDDAGNMVQEVVRNFVYDSSIDDSLFAVGVPADYEADIELATLATTNPRSFPIAPGVGVGPLKFGMTESEVVEVLGEPRSQRAAAKGQLLDYGAEGLYLEVSGEEGLRAIHCISQLAYGFDVRTFSGKTDNGIGIGASLQQVREAYGEPVQEYQNSGIALMQYVSPVVAFKFREGKLSEVILVTPSKDH